MKQETHIGDYLGRPVFLIAPNARKSTASPVDAGGLRYGYGRPISLDESRMPTRMRRELPHAYGRAVKVEQWEGFLRAAMLEGRI